MRWMCLLFCAALFGNQDPAHLAVTEGYPSFLINGCVSAITGDYYYHVDDVVVTGAEPIRIPRNYLSSRHLKGRAGWSNLKHLYAKINGMYIKTTEANGTKLDYLQEPEANGRCRLTHYSQALTNCARGELSARHDLSNQYVIPNKAFDHFRVFAADGTVRIFKKASVKHNKGTAIFYFCLQREELPNGHLVHYSYNDKRELIEIKTTNADMSKVFAWAKFEWPAKDTNSQNHKITTSDGQSFDLVYKRLKHYDHELFEYLGKKEISILRKANSWNKPLEQYEYYLSCKDFNPKLRTIHLPHNRSHTIQYYDDHRRFTLSTGITIKLSGPSDRRLGSVSSLLDGQQNTLYSFIYHFPAKPGSSTFTEVYDALGNKTVYVSNSAYYPVFIKRYDGKKLISTERFTFYQHRLKSVALYDEKGICVNQRDYFYDDAGNVITEKLLFNGQTAITKRTFTKNHLLQSETSPAGLITRYTYLGGTDLIATKTLEDQDGIFLTETYTYDADNLLQTKTVSDGQTHKITTYERLQSGAFIGMPSAITESTPHKIISRIEFDYNQHGQICKKRIYDANNLHRYTETMDYDKRGRLISKTDALDQKTSYVYDTYDNITHTEHPSGAFLDMEYDYRNRLTQKTENGKRTTRYQYNARSDLTEMTDYRGEVTNYTYDGLGRLIRTVGPMDFTTETAYDAQNNPISQTEANGFVTQTAYNGISLPIQITYPDGAIEKKTYDVAGRLISETNAANVQTTYTLDTLGRILSKKTPLTCEEWTYSAFDVLKYTDSENNATLYTYDDAGRKIGEELAGEKISYTYDALGRIETIQKGVSIFRTDYDLLNRPIAEIAEDSDKNLYTKIAYTYDAFNNKTSIIRSCGTETYAYDFFNRITLHTDAFGHQTLTTYPDDFTTITTDALGRQTIETRDSLDRTVAVQTLDPNGKELAKEIFTYDPNGNRLSQTSTIYRAEARRTSTLRWEYDNRNRLTRLIEAANTDLERSTQIAYTPTGQIATYTKPSGIVLQSTYDELDRLSTFISSDGTIHYRYSYNGLNQLTYVIDAVTQTTTKRTFDPQGRLLFEGLANGFTLSSTYDSAGRRTKLHLPSGTVEYTYDAHFLRAVSYKNHTHHYLSYDTDGHLLSQKLIRDHGTVDYTIDALGRTTQLKHPHCSHHLKRFDPVGNVLESDTTTYTYDHLNHLTSENDKNYTFDSHHNRDEVNVLNQLPGIIYDPDGNPLQVDNTHYTYDALGRLTAVEQNGTKTTYTYDFLHRRLTSSDGTRYLYDDKNEIGTDKQLRILGQGQGAEIGAAVILEIDDYIYAPLHDLFGNLTILFYAGATPYQSYTFDAFSHTATSTWLTSPYSPWRYSSKRHDPSGLIYFGRRYYDPTRGRFLTPDPTGFTDSPNLYQYTLGNPLLNHDLYGEFTLDCEKIRQNTGKALWFTGTHLTLSESTGIKFRRWGATLSGLDLPTRFEQPNIISIVEGKEHPIFKFISGNGIMNNFDDALKMAYAHFDANGGYNVHHVYNPSKGFLRDLVRVGMEKLSFQTQSIKLATDLLNQTIEEGKIPFSIWHSEGGLIGRRAHEYCNYKGFIQENAFAYTLGSAGLMPRSLVNQSMNYISAWDPVPVLAHFTHPRYHLESNVTMLKPQEGFILTDHAFDSATYSDALRNIYVNINEQ